uniref:Coenzyme Q-binding protein COQ10 START domain-containing protein n=1 Tax=Lygus hesperus TaxID=30085 RepID=A0A0K8T9Q7_LYGHE
MHNARFALFELCPKRNSSRFPEVLRCLFSTEIHTRSFSKLKSPEGVNLSGDVCSKRHFFTIPGITSSKRKEYVGRKIVGFTPDEMFQVVSDVENYRSFVPFCIRSDVNKRTEQLLLGRLEIGFPPLIESYVSRVTMNRPHLVKADCTDGKLFDHLTTTWKFSPVPKGNARSTAIFFYLSFEFKSALHSQLAIVFFNQLVQQMEQAFIREAERRFGAPSIRTIHLSPPRT